jgi:hypothetical protein
VCSSWGRGRLPVPVAFVVLQNVLLSGLFLMLGGLLSTAVLVAVYDRLRETDASLALWALLNGFLVNPALYILLGLAFLRGGGS